MWDPEAMLEKLPLRTLLDHVREKSPVALNVLDLPLGKVVVAIPPGFRDLSADAYSVNLVSRLAKLEDMSDTTSWGTASTQNALSWFHCDDLGLATSVWVQTGGKWWVLARQKDGLAEEMSDVATLVEWDVEKIDAKTWEAEAVHLEPNCVL